MRLLIIAGIVVMAQAPAEAGLVFDSDVVRSTARPDEEHHTVRIPFRVDGAQPIHITEIDSTCGCLSAAADQEDYKPGEKGMITAVFRLGSFEGEVTKSLFVLSNDPADARRRLSISITIPKLFEIAPEVTSWAVGEEPKPKTISFKVLQEKPVEITGITSTREAFKPEVKEVIKGREYQIILTPATTAEPVLGALRIQTTCELPRYRHRLCFFNVLRPRPTAAATK
jgi:hypothetical protein